MSKKNENKAAVEAESPAAATATAAAPASGETAKKHESLVDQVFDTVIARAAQGLVAAKKGLEATARWLDGRAKFVGELASKLAPEARV